MIDITTLLPMMPPVEILESDEYELVIKDNMGVMHYWTAEGYDGCSFELQKLD